MDSADSSWTEIATHWLVEGSQDRLPPTLTEAISNATAPELEQLLTQLDLPTSAVDSSGPDEPSRSAPSPSAQESSNTPHLATRLRTLLQQVAARTLRLRLTNNDPSPAAIIDPDITADLALELVAISPEAAAHCLQILAAQGDTRSLELLCDTLKQATFEDEACIAVALSPLFQWPPADLASVFSMLGDDIWRWNCWVSCWTWPATRCAKAD